MRRAGKKVQKLCGAKGGVDLVVDPVGDRFTEPAVRALAWGGRLLVIGFAAGEIPKIPANLLLLKGAAAVGVFHGMWPLHDTEGPREAEAELLKMVAQGSIAPAVSAVYPLEDAAVALTDMMQRRSTGKLVLGTRAGLATTEAAQSQGGSKL